VNCIQNTICKGDDLIYTDGSKTRTGVGAAFYHPHKNHAQGYSLPPETSIFSAEAFAIITALKYITSLQESHFAILTDSKSVLQALETNCFKSTTNWLQFDLKARIQTAKKAGKTIKLIWIPGHSDILGNEVVDKAAKSSANEPKYNLPIPYTDIIPILKAQQIEQWQKHWTKSWEHIRHHTSIGGPSATPWYKSVVPELPSNPFKPWYHKKMISKQTIFIATRLRTGHCKIPAHLAALNITPDNSCECGEIATLNHSFFHCPINELETAQLILELNNMNITPDDINWSISELLKKNSTTILNLLITFIRKTSTNL
jgi:ribonuclease HI